VLSFAQFEREVTGERIRDKIAASKAKGMWMGGMPPLGYDVRERKLVINPAEATIVRNIFERYLTIGSTRALATDLEGAGIRSKSWVTRAGKFMGGGVISRGAVIHILQSRVYVGEIVHKGLVHPGLHDPIVSRELFDRVAAKLSDLAVSRRELPIKATPGPLAGRLFDSSGEPMSPSFAYGRRGRLYRYYIAGALQVGVVDPACRGPIRRASAPAVETYLVDQLQRLAGRNDIRTPDLASMIHQVHLKAEETHIVLNGNAVFPREHPELALSALRRRLAQGEEAVSDPGTFRIRVALPHRLQLRGGRTILHGGKGDERGRINPGLVHALKRAHADLIDLGASPFSSTCDLVGAMAPATQHDRQVARLAFMAPDLQRQILAGRQHADLKLRQVLKSPMPLAWADQRRWLEGLARGQ